MWRVACWARGSTRGEAVGGGCRGEMAGRGLAGFGMARIGPGGAGRLGAADVEEEGRVRLLQEQLVPLLRHVPREEGAAAGRPRRALDALLVFNAALSLDTQHSGRKAIADRVLGMWGACDQRAAEAAAVDAVRTAQVVRHGVEERAGVAAPFHGYNTFDPILMSKKCLSDARLQTELQLQRNLDLP